MSFKHTNIFHYDAYMHLSCLKQFSEEQQFQIIDEAEVQAGSFFKKFRSFHLTMSTIGLLIFGLIYYFTNSFGWPSIWLSLWSSYVLIFASNSRKVKHLQPHIEQIAKDKSINN